MTFLKSIQLFLIMTLFIFTKTNAQECGQDLIRKDFFAHATEAEKKKWWDGSKSSKNKALDKAYKNSSIRIPIQVYVVRKNNGKGGSTENELLRGLEVLNQDYAATPYQFYYHDIQYINSDQYFILLNTNEGNALYNTYSNSGALNMYIVGYLQTGFNGYARFPWTSNSNAFFFTHHAVNTAIYAHEIGHYFGLFHTHETFQGTELVNGNNCSTAGDGLCDTPADPQITAVNVDSTCVYIGTATDPNGDSYNPEPRNIMSYARMECRDLFTPDQISRMNYYYNNYRINELSNLSEFIPTNSCPPFSDSDVDGVCDFTDTCPDVFDVDMDNNGIMDGCESCPLINFEQTDVRLYSQDGNNDFWYNWTWINPYYLHLQENSWKAIPIQYNVTPNTRIAFDFKSSIEGEIHELSFDNDLSFPPEHRYVLYGNQSVSATNIYNYPYTEEGDFEHFNIHLGNTFTGYIEYLILVVDEDASNGGHIPGNSFFRNVRIFEDPDADGLCNPNCVVGSVCDDSDACTDGDAYDANCNCVGTFSDSDNDGICDLNDQCDGLDDAFIGQPCDDGDQCTTGETYNTSCGCTGGIFLDTDNDGICDFNDDTNGGCSLGATCDDGEDCTVGDAYDSNCNCVGTLSDTDNDGICDLNDQCEGLDDALIGQPCDDGDQCTTGETYNTSCGCTGGIFLDTDNDGICDFDDDTNGDCSLGAICDDGEDCTVGDAYDSNCNCVGTLSDSDNDGVCDLNDQCEGLDDALIGQPCDDGDPCTIGENYDTSSCGCSGGSLLDQNSNGICDLNETCTGTLPESESFEVNLGSWSQSGGDDLNWTRDSGGTPSSNTGPSNAPDGSWYMYIEASSPNYPAKTAGLQSDCYNLAGSGIVTLNFTYHMYGSASTMNLRVEVSTDEGNSWSNALWSTSGNQGNQWLSASVDLSAYVDQTINVRFWGTTGTTWQGDIAIDAVSITTQEVCTSFGDACDDNDICTIGDQIDAMCNCVGTLSDSDNDGVCDLNDQCNGLDDALIGQPCNDGNPCIVGELYDATCGCSGGVLLDSNSNGVCDLDEACSEFTINNENFASGLGIWNDGGSDARRSIYDAAYANSGSYCVRLRDNSSTSVITTDILDLSAYEFISVDFSYITRSMDNSSEDFWFQISYNGGASYSIVEEWNLNDEFVNGLRESGTVTVQGPFSSNMRLRFRADASGNSDWVYLDDINISGCAVSGGISFKDDPIVSTKSYKSEVDQSIAKDVTIELYPNPTRDFIFILGDVNDCSEKDKVLVFNSAGIKIIDRDLKHIEGSTGLDVSEFTNGVYLMQLQHNGKLYNKRFIVQK